MNRADTSNAADRPGILPGFADPIHDAQRCFRAVLEAMAHPGKPVELAVLPPALYLNASMPPACLAGMVAVALTLCDADTPVWLDPCLDTPAMRRHLRFHCGCPIVAEPGTARFALIGDAIKMPRFDKFIAGDPEYPDRSATLIIAADFTAAAPGLRLSGPGISPARYPHGLPFDPAGLPAWFWEDRAANRTGYPLGVDVLFVDSGQIDSGQTGSDAVRIAGLPRTTDAVPASRAASGAFKENTACTLQ
ncbi:Phosphonate C-P lyase system protein PhnH [uncultured delta proteobacterium]|uniref:Phosphonate C-P lyase system protein PhnH n=1 Tax=uncultured delta proteobacterium TaxID=34034 RepID=A0A212K6I8_9DELT|nr:Phosphonate C-P lyase system protein PhnH [uncultured delta proteobacterium]